MGYFNGIYAASLSILDNNLQLDCEKTLKHAENLIEKGCHGVIFFGSTGQSQLISLSEKIKLINILPKSKHKDKFIIGTGLNSLGDNINLINISKSIGFENFLGLGGAFGKKFGPKTPSMLDFWWNLDPPNLDFCNTLQCF